MYQALLDAVEHHNGKQRIPLITSIGSSVCVNDISPEELQVWMDEWMDIPHGIASVKYLSIEPLYVCCSYLPTQIACKELWSYANGAL